MHKKSSHTNNMQTNNSHKRPSHKQYENKYFAAINKHKAKIYELQVYPNYYKKLLLFFFTEYKNEWK